MLSYSPAWAKSVHGIFKVVKGKVHVTHKGKKKKARIGMKVFPKDIVEAEKNSRAKIVMIDKNEINITPETKMEIADYKFNPKAGKKSVLLNVIHGKIRAKVKQKYKGAKNNRFQVKTPSAVAGVRGTDFFTSYNPSNDATRVVTFEGRVEFGVPGANGAILDSVMVDVGQVSNSLAGAIPTKPIELPKTELKVFDQGSDANQNIEIPDSFGRREPADINIDEGREPANAPPLPGTMLRPEDMVAGPEGGNFDHMGPMMPPPPPGAGGFYPRGPGNFVPICEFCNEVIQDGTRSLILNVQHQ